MIRRFYGGVKSLILLHLRKIIFLCIGVVLIVLTAIQLLYPSNTLLPLTSVEGVNLSGLSKSAAIQALDSEYSQVSINIFFGSDSSGVYSNPKPSDIGITVSNEQRINQMNYPWYLRLAPGSLFWGHFVIKPSSGTVYSRDSAKLNEYIRNEWGDSCSVQPKDASVKLEDNQVVVQEGNDGGTCAIKDAFMSLDNVNLSIVSDVSVIVPAVLIPATVSNSDANKLAKEINDKTKDGIEIAINDDKVVIPRDQVVSWIDLSSSGGKLDFSLNAGRASEFLTNQLAQKVSRAPGTTTISTHDFVETSRQTGVSGQTLDINLTLENIKDYILGEADSAQIGVVTTDPQIQYERSYSQTNVGLSSLISNFATTHAGTYGVVLTELSGQYRRATYNSTQSFTTASTYKLFVAYSTLKRVESGVWQWTDQIQGGRNLTKCFDDMIVLSDNNCAYTLLNKIGFTNITNEAKAIGCIHTSFLGSDGIKSTPEDIALLLAELQTGQILGQQSSRDILINAMKRNVYRLGIPKGTTGTVANKVGFLDALIHDAAIVYSSTGPYVLVIMTNGSSWTNIAELTRQIEALRVQ